jgi:cytochrome c oxidase subunit II
MSDSAPGSTATEVAARVELRWAIAVAAIIVLLISVIAFTALHWSSMPPSRVEVIDPTTLHRSGEFVESNLGTGIDARNQVILHLLAEQYAFRPACLLVPAGVPVTVRATSADVVHGFQILGTNVNTMLIPGYVSTFVMTLNGVGERSMPCHEFCGVGHAAMWATVKVVPLAEFETLMRQKRRASCV